MDKQGRLEHKVYKVLRDQLEIQEHREHQDLKDPQGVLGRLDPQERMVLLGLLEQRELWGQ